MEQDKLFSHVRGCFSGESPACAGACPLHLDVRSFIARVQKGKFDQAHKILERDLYFPEIVAETCDQPCQQNCVRMKVDSSICLRQLERATIANRKPKVSPRYHLPPREQKIAVIGAGISGLFCAYALAIKQYRVEVHEASAVLGGRLAEHPQAALFQEEIERQFEGKEVRFVLSHRVEELAELDADAIYVATGRQGHDFGLLPSWKAQSLDTGRDDVFMGGGLVGAFGISGAGQGKRAADRIDLFIRAGKTRQAPPSPEEICRFIPWTGIAPQESSLRDNETDAESAVSEANRCLRCDCDECMKTCLMLREYQNSPNELAKKILADSSVVSHGQATRQVARQLASCNLCGLCKQNCPTEVDVGGMILFARQDRVAAGNYPPVFHEYWLKQMAFSREQASLVRLPAGHERCAHAFFPGCQLGASNPQYVSQSYALLTEILEGGTGLFLSCCGAPAYWAGEEELHKKVIASLRASWEAMGRPTVVLACATCLKLWKSFLPDVRTLSLYELLADALETSRMPSAGSGFDGAVFDSCAARTFPAMRAGVRRLAQAAGARIHEVQLHDKEAQCCGWGGHIQAANPALFDRVVTDRIEADPAPYLVYCANCRDTFRAKGKNCSHILGLVLGLDENGAAPSIREKHENSLSLVASLLHQFWGESCEQPQTAANPMNLQYAPGLQQKMEKLLISEEVVVQGIKLAEESSVKTLNRDSGEYTCSYREGTVTYWIQYSQKGADHFKVNDIYCHRMHILGEAE